MPALNKAISIPLAALLFIGGGAVAGYTSLAGAQTNNPATKSERSVKGPLLVGTITAVNGSAITITAEGKQSGTYTVDASKAEVHKNGGTSSVASLAVGEKIAVLGTTNGTSVTATKIMSGFGEGFGPKGRDEKGERKEHGMMGKNHGVVGKVTAINGSTITVTGQNGKSYNVNTGSTTVHKVVTGSLSDIVVGDTIGVRGSVSGNTVTATDIMDDVPALKAKR